MADVTSNDGPSAVVVATWTVTGPVEAPVGTTAVMLVSVEVTAVAVVPLKVTTLSLWFEPKPAPVIVTVEPTDPAAGDIAGTDKGSSTVNEKLVLATPSSTTVNGPLVALVGAVAVMLVSLHGYASTAAPLNWTWPYPV